METRRKIAGNFKKFKELRPQAFIFAKMQKEKPNIRTFSEAELKSWLADQGEKAFRGRQIREWLWKKHATAFDEMTSLSKELRNKLKAHFRLPALQVSHLQKSRDKTIKVGFRLEDDLLVEGVLIPSGGRYTACISSQVGCALGCRFCATARLGWNRNLVFDEIFDQVALLEKVCRENYQDKLDNIVLMGMGEPLQNYENVRKAIELLTGEGGPGYSPSRITLSTVGIIKGIKRMADEQVKYNLAVSLHAATDEKRSEIIPVNRQNNLEALGRSLKYFHEKTGTRITLEYLLMDNFNDNPEDAAKLAVFCRQFPCKINLIPYNPVEGVPYKTSEELKTLRFKTLLEKRNLVVNIRQSRGTDIDAACGQLANTLKKPGLRGKSGRPGTKTT